MKKPKILAENQQKIGKSPEKLQKTEEIQEISKGTAQMLFWHLIPQISDAYSTYCGLLSYIYKKQPIIIEEEDNGKGKKEIRK